MQQLGARVANNTTLYFPLFQIIISQTNTQEQKKTN